MPIRKRKRMDLVLPTSSMGDIAFLLIIFFILASNFMKSANIEAEKPSSQEVDAIDDAQVDVVIDKNGKFYVQGIEVDKNLIESAVQQAVGEHRDKPVHLLVDKNLQKKDFMPAIEALGSCGVKVILVGEKK